MSEYLHFNFEFWSICIWTILSVLKPILPVESVLPLKGVFLLFFYWSLELFNSVVFFFILNVGQNNNSFLLIMKICNNKSIFVSVWQLKKYKQNVLSEYVIDFMYFY